MTRVLVTGGRGGLGREVVARLKADRRTVRVMSRSAAGSDDDHAVEWAQADLESGAGLVDAVQDVDVIVNCASNPAANTYQVDVVGTKSLLEAAQAAGVKHFIHISILGIDKIDTPYYRNKVAAEEVVKAGGVPYSIMRAAQFHTLLDGFLTPLRETSEPPAIQPDAQYQLIETGECADYLLPYVNENAIGQIPDVGGPEIMRLDEIARLWLEAQGLAMPTTFSATKPVIGGAMRGGYNTAPDNRYGKITWAGYLKGKYGA